MIDKRLNFGEGFEILLTRGTSSFKEVLDTIQDSKHISIATYNISKEAEELITLLKSLPASAKVRFVTNVPGRYHTYFYEKNKKDARDALKNYFSKLAPGRFKCDIDVYFNFNNHAKILLTDTHGYIGSANFSSESKNNFEAGILIRSAEKIRDVENELFDEIIADSRRYLGDFAEGLGLELHQYANDLRESMEYIDANNRHLFPVYEQETAGRVRIMPLELNELEAVLWLVDDCLKDIERSMKFLSYTEPLLSEVATMIAIVKAGSSIRTWSNFKEDLEIAEYFQNDPHNTGDNTDESMDRAMDAIAWEKEELQEGATETYYQLSSDAESLIFKLINLAEQIIGLAQEAKKINNTGLDL